MKKMRVVLVDDEIMIREGFKKLFNWEEHDCQVVGEASDGMEALTVNRGTVARHCDHGYQHSNHERSESNPDLQAPLSGHGIYYCIWL